MGQIAKKETEAMKWYDEAIHSAKTSSDIQIEALANELAGDFYAKKACIALRKHTYVKRIDVIGCGGAQQSGTAAARLS